MHPGPTLGSLTASCSSVGMGLGTLRVGTTTGSAPWRRVALTGRCVANLDPLMAWQPATMAITALLAII